MKNPDPVRGQIEYAGFQYLIEEIDGRLTATPLPGQHHAAGKEKHRQAAVEQYREEKK